MIKLALLGVLVIFALLGVFSVVAALRHWGEPMACPVIWDYRSPAAR